MGTKITADFLDRILNNLQSSRGPFVIIARPHSGTRMLARVFIENDIYCGSNISKYFLDSADWYDHFVFPYILSRFFPYQEHYLSDQYFHGFCHKLMAKSLISFFRTNPKPSKWGWKLSETSFVMPVIKLYFPQVKFIHLIRDGRDVALSNNGYFQMTDLYPDFKRDTFFPWVKKNSDNFLRHKYRIFCMNVTFNNSEIKCWRNIELNRKKDIVDNRFAIQMKSWINCIETSRQFGSTMKDSYFEIKYEDLCRRPLNVIEKLFRYLDLRMTSEARAFLKTETTTDRIGKWKTCEYQASKSRDFKAAVEIGKPLLRKLGYSI